MLIRHRGTNAIVKVPLGPPPCRRRRERPTYVDPNCWVITMAEGPEEQIELTRRGFEICE